MLNLSLWFLSLLYMSMSILGSSVLLAFLLTCLFFSLPFPHHVTTKGIALVKQAEDATSNKKVNGLHDFEVAFLTKWCINCIIYLWFSYCSSYEWCHILGAICLCYYPCYFVHLNENVYTQKKEYCGSTGAGDKKPILLIKLRFFIHLWKLKLVSCFRFLFKRWLSCMTSTWHMWMIVSKIILFFTRFCFE